jgi:hypothetical protein
MLFISENIKTLNNDSMNMTQYTKIINDIINYKHCAMNKEIKGDSNHNALEICAISINAWRIMNGMGALRYST